MGVNTTFTGLLEACGQGDRNSESRLMELVYDELRGMASSFLQREQPGHTLQTTALVHEAYLRLAGTDVVHSPSRGYFFGSAARAMRRILIDHARRKQAARRDGGLRIDLDAARIGLGSEESVHDLLAVDQALDRLAALDPRQAQVVELRFFGGLSIEEAAVALDVSEPTVKRDWTMARAWLKGELQA